MLSVCRVYLLDYDFLRVSKDGFVPVHAKLVENWLNHT
jgi:hypothetical protein